LALFFYFRPDINAIRALTSAQPGTAKGTPATAVGRVAAEERELPRQGSLVDGEGIKIVIHDVDSDLGKSANTSEELLISPHFSLFLFR
jgi:predicted lipoprotein with Yx(FWY)xxD motif